MSTIAARKLRTVLRNVQAVLAIEFLVAAQGVEWRVAMGINPQEKKRGGAEGEGDQTTGGRNQPRPEVLSDWEKAVEESRKLKESVAPERRQDIASRLGEGTRAAYLKVRELAPPMLTDRVLDEDIRAVRGWVEGRANARASALPKRK